MKGASTGSGPLAPRLLLSGIAIVLTLSSLEVLARVWVSHFASREQFTRYASLAEYNERIGGEEWWFGLLAPHRYLGYTLAPNLLDGKNRHNSLGFRGEELEVPKPEGEFRIACIGASTTYSLLVPDASQSYPALVQESLRERGHPNVTVVNAGVPAWTSYENLINYLLRIQDLEPDLIIVKEAFADVACRMVWPPSAFRADNSGCLAPQVKPRGLPLYQASTLARILLVTSGRSLPTSALGVSIYNQADTSYFFEFAKQRWGWRYPDGIFETIPVARMLEANSSEHYRQNVESLLLQARAQGVRAVLMTFPYSPQVPGYFDIDGIRAAVDEHNEFLRQVAAQRGVPLIDMAAIFPTDPAYWGFDGIHANEKGTALESQLVTDFLLEHELVGDPSPRSGPARGQASASPS